MATITSLGASDNGATSRTTINTNFTNLNTDKIETSVISTDGTMADNSDTELPTEKAVKTYVDTTTAATVLTQFDTTQVFTGTAPTSFTDLDLSSVIGVNQKMVMLKVTCNTGGGYYFSFRRNGETATIAVSANAGASMFYTATSGYIGYILVPTDTSGVVEWYSSGEASTTINVEAYW